MATPFRIQKYLRGLRYPAFKTDAIAHARALGADSALLAALDALDADAVYPSPVALSRALAHRPIPTAAAEFPARKG